MIIKEDNNNLSKLLNILDGIIECPGRIIIMTTNKPETLDKALIRPGRIDIKINFTKCTKQMTQDIINNYFNSKIKITNIKDYKYTPAELIELCSKYKNENELLKFLYKD